MSSDIFSQLRHLAERGAVGEALELLAQQYREQGAYAELFEALKMRARQQLGLPLIAWNEVGGELSGASPAQQQQLEQALYRACEEVGELLFRAGRPALAWKYYQLVGNRPQAARLLRLVPVTQEILAELIHVAADAGVDPVYGLELTIEHQGLCNGITLYDRQIGFEPRSVREQAAGILVAALYDELVRALRREIEAAEGKSLPPELSLEALIAERPWLCAEGRVHVDVSHLGSVIRIAKVSSDRSVLTRALELCGYGNLLDPQLRGGGDPPFPDHFADHRRWYAAVLGDNAGEGTSYFQAQAEAAPPDSEERRAAWEAVVAIHWALGQSDQALHVSLRELDGREGPTGLVPTALELAGRGGQLAELAEFFAQEHNLLMFATALLLERSAAGTPTHPTP